MEHALDGVRVADFTTAHQGPWATQKLGDMGADVVKIERPGGEWSRSLTTGGGYDVDGQSPFWLSANRSKRSVTLDLKSDEGRAVALDLIESADVLVENFRPGVMGRLGLDYETVRERTSDLVYVSASGFGTDGPYADRPGQDLLVQSLAGIPPTVGHADHPPMPVPFPLVDGHAAMHLAYKTMVALFHRERTGEGQRVTVNLLDAALDTQCQGFTVELNVDHEFERSAAGIGQKYLDAPYGLYETADGHVAIAMASMDALAEALDVPEVGGYEPPETFERRDEIKRELEAHTREFTTEAVLDRLVAADLWAAQVNDFAAAAEHPQVEHNGMIVEVDHPDGGTFRTTGIPGSLSATPGAVQSRPPRPGEHTAEVLAEAGYSAAEVDALVEAGVATVDDAE